MAVKLVITLLIHNKDDIQFVTEFPCLLGHPVYVAYSRPNGWTNFLWTLRGGRGGL